MGMMSAARETGRARSAATAGRSAAMRYWSAMAATDRALSLLEELNLRDRGRSEPDARVRAAIDRAAGMLPAEASAKVRPWPTVQEALDGIFDVQEALFAKRRQELYCEQLAGEGLDQLLGVACG